MYNQWLNKRGNKMIKFGTSGWRGIIADDFTFDNVKIVTQAIANYLINDDKEYKKDKAVIIGYDARFLSDKYANISAENMHSTICLVAPARLSTYSPAFCPL